MNRLGAWAKATILHNSAWAGCYEEQHPFFKASFARTPTEFCYPDQSSAGLNRGKRDRHQGREPLGSGVFWQWEVDPKCVVQHQKELPYCYVALRYVMLHYIAHTSILTGTYAELVNAWSFPWCTLLLTHFAVPGTVVIQLHTFLNQNGFLFAMWLDSILHFLMLTASVCNTFQTSFPCIIHRFN